MTRDEMTTYKWLDADEMRPRKESNDAQRATSQLLQKLMEMFISDN